VSGRPLYDKVLIKRIKQSDKAGLIHLPESAQESSYKGEIIAVGDGRVLEDGSLRPLIVKVGDVVIFSPHVALRLNLDDGEQYLLLPEREIYYIVSEGNKNE
jgi:chaperonin GroES